MKTRRLKKVIDDLGRERLEIVWFGSYGKDEDNHSLFYNELNKHDNFSFEQDSIVDDLTQKLNILRGELWYDVMFGLPLLEKNSSKSLIDSTVLSIIQSNSEIKSITSFKSKIENHNYYCDVIIDSIFGKLNFSI